MRYIYEIVLSGYIGMLKVEVYPILRAVEVFGFGECLSISHLKVCDVFD